MSFNRFYNLRVKKFRFLNHLSFLLKCRRLRIIPSFIDVKCNLSSTKKLDKILCFTKLSILRNVIKETRKKLADIEFELFHLHLELGQLPNFSDLDRNSWLYTMSCSVKHRSNLHRKFLRISAKLDQSTSSSIITSDVSAIVNLSDITLTPIQEKVLMLNNNFSITPKVNLVNFIAPIEKAIKNCNLPNCEKDNLRYRVSGVCKDICSSTYKPNLSPREKSSFNELIKNPDIYISRADKGGQIVIFNRSVYIDKVSCLLNDGPYLRLKKDPTDNNFRKLSASVKSSPIIDKCLCKSLLPSNYNCARLYALPKIHKPNVPFRPIVSCINTPCYNLSKYLVSIFSNLKPISIFSVKNSIEFVNNLKSIKPHNQIMVSFDVISLFTNIPMKGALDRLFLKLREFHFSEFEATHLVHLTKLCLEQNSFVFQDSYFSQNEGLAMGNCLSPILAEIYLSFFESTLFSTISYFSHWFRYVDDTFVLIDSNVDPVDVLSTLNTIDPHIQFTMEVEVNNALPFLDVLVFHNSFEFFTSIYRKAFTVNLPPHSNSCHPFGQKMSSFYFFVFRALQICSPEYLNTELDFLKLVAVKRGFSSSIIDRAVCKFRNSKFNSSINFNVSNLCILPFYPRLSVKVRNLLVKSGFHVVFKPVIKLNFSMLKDPIPSSKKWGIYSIPCECGKCYIGQTRRSLFVRVKEHISYVKKHEIVKSSIAAHCWNENHNFLFDKAKIIKTVSSPTFLDFFESYFILRNSDALVNDLSSSPPFSDIWKLLLF